MAMKHSVPTGAHGTSHCGADFVVVAKMVENNIGLIHTLCGKLVYHFKRYKDIRNNMAPATKWSLRKWCTIFGSLLLMLPIGLPWYWGNMAVYAVSYVALCGESLSGVHTPWIISFYFMFNAVGLFIAGSVSKIYGKRPVLLFGMVMFLSGFFLTYFSIKKSVVVMNFTLGIVSGVGGGVINGMALQYAVGWTGNDLGFVTAFVQSGFNAGSVFINPFITFYVNPDNLSSDLSLGTSKIFSSSKVLDSVPPFFAIFGLFCLAFLSVGFVMVRESSPCRYYDEEGEESELLMKEENDTISFSGDKSKTSQCLETGDNDPASGDADTNYEDKTPSEMIQTKLFLTLGISLMMYDNAMLVLANYYKQFGATYIDDDHFLSFLGTVLTSSTIVAFPLWGSLTDRIGVKTTLIIMYSVSSILCFIVFFTPRLSRWVYMVNIACLGSFLAPIFSILITTTCKLFGKTHYSSNIGVVASLSLLINFVNPLIFEAILDLGWFYIFCYGGFLTGTALVVIVLTLPDI